MVEPVSATPFADPSARPVPPAARPVPPAVDLHPFEPPEGLFQQRAEPQPQAQPRPPDRESVKGQVEAMNKLMEGLGHRLEFGLFQDSDQLFVKVVDRINNKVVKVIPPEELLALRQKISDAVGMLLDDQL